MAVNQHDSGAGSSVSSGRKLAVGSNVVVVTLIFAAIVVFAQVMAYDGARWDMTSSGVNSLSDGSTNLLNSLDQNVRLTSLYFETDREDQDQPKFRRSAKDLLDLYEATNRAKISAEWINPLKDHEKLQKLIARLREKTVFKDAVEKYESHLKKYKDELDGKMKALISGELATVAPIAGGGGIGGGGQPTPIAQVEELFKRLGAELEAARERVDALTTTTPQLSAATGELKSLYPQLSKALKEVSKFAQAELARDPKMPMAAANFLKDANSRYAELVGAIEAETTALQELEPLKLDDILDQLAPTANAILVETDADARVVDFDSVFPPIDQQSAGGRVPFEKRAFKGEEKLTAAILRATHKEQTAVIFVRYGGQPMFMGGMMPGMPSGGYSMMKLQLEDANFIVEEWDLKAKTTPPEINPKPTRTIYVVFKPESQQRNPMMPQQPPEQPFGETHRKAILDAIGDKGRALFVGGWSPGPFGPMPSEYEYNEFLKSNWGINVDTSALLIEVTNVAPGKYAVGRRDFFNMDRLETQDHDIVRGSAARQVGLPWSAPLAVASPAPEGVQVQKLVVLPKRDGVWGIKNIQAYQDQMERSDFLTRVEGDLEGPFDLAVAATKGDAKVVVVSSREFARDEVAFARELGMSAQGLTIRSRNPGNVTLLVNSLHWLNDNTGFMNIGRPIDAAVLEIDSPTKVKVVQAFTIFLWPVLALIGGGIAWAVRRK